MLDIPGSNPPNPFSTPIRALLTLSKHSSTPAPDETATNLVNSMTTSSDPVHAPWELWDALFTAVATSLTSHEPPLALLAIHAHVPTHLTRTGATCTIYSRPGATGTVCVTRAKDSSTISTVGSSGGEYFLRFCVFSAALLKATKGKDKVHPIWIFYACRDVLERERPQYCPPKAHRMSSEQVWALDVRAATWMRDGGWALSEADYEELRRHWAAALDDKTELWPRGDGLTRERWLLWGERLRGLSIEGTLDKETVAVIVEAAEVVSGILEDSNLGY
ncbi:unnamed protein product [Penicillium egyptiacum]|uniref:Uncharacterized protein n=1 Tax=Penicillium egyptiacum TaxID=1303716 RepID=A0A9W4P8C0_9EURO|nr:unnamed protein product [Penicillium egyptiacum]